MAISRYTQLASAEQDSSALPYFSAGEPKFLGSIRRRSHHRLTVATLTTIALLTIGFFVVYHDTSRARESLRQIQSQIQHSFGQAPYLQDHTALLPPKPDEINAPTSSISTPTDKTAVPTSSTSVQQSKIPEVDWSRFAYTQYVTNTDYLCNSVMMFETLHRLGSKPDRLLMYPETMSFDETPTTKEAELLLKAKSEYGAKLQPIKVLHRESMDATWADSYTKLLAFNQTQYARVLNLDSDAVVLQPMDELFELPEAPVAMPRAYWNPVKGQQQLSDQLLLVEPSEDEFIRIQEHINSAGDRVFDMDIVNDIYDHSCMVLPHRRYDLLTGEFRSKDRTHANYLGNTYEKWDAHAALKEAKFLHFSDWPVPKPWIHAGAAVMQSEQPACIPAQNNGTADCTDREVWRGIYSDFARRRKDICGLDLNGSSSKAVRDAARRPRRNEPLFG